MLSLFKETTLPLEKNELLAQARHLLVSSLNKGLIPDWENFFHDLPLLDKAEDLEEIRHNFTLLTEWPFLRNILCLEATEFFFHSPMRSQRLTLSGKKSPIQVPLTEEDWQLWLEIFSLKFRQNWNVQSPFCSFYGELFGKKYRFSLIHASTSPENISKLVVRCLAHTPHPLESFGETDLLKTLVEHKKNVLIAGSTGSGKTSLLSTLLNSCSQDEHLVVLEDTYEIISHHPHQTRMLSQDQGDRSLKSYLSYSLRLSPDRIVLGEIRSHEVVPFLMAMNTGHSGLMATIHASSAHDALHRVALLFSLYASEANLSFEKVMELLCRNLEYVVFMENKKVKQVIKILGAEKGSAFFETCSEEGIKELNLF